MALHYRGITQISRARDSVRELTKQGGVAALVRYQDVAKNIDPMLIVGIIRSMRVSPGSSSSKPPMVWVQINNLEYELSLDDTLSLFRPDERVEISIPFMGQQALQGLHLDMGEPPVPEPLLQEAVDSIRKESDRRQNSA